MNAESREKAFHNEDRDKLTFRQSDTIGRLL